MLRRTLTTPGSSSSYLHATSNCSGYSEYQPGASSLFSNGGASTSASTLSKTIPESSSSKAMPSKCKRRKKRKVEAISVGDDAGGEIEPPKPKRARKKKDPDAPAPEKREAMFKPRCPQNVLERAQRVALQRFFLVDRRRERDELKEEFSVLGSTGNVYVVTIDKRPSCTCPDAMKGNHCKHILFVLTKVLQVSQSSHIWYQKALLTSELEEVFRNAPPTPGCMASAQVREAYDRASGKAPSTTQVEPARRELTADDYCAICYDAMHETQGSKLTWCQTCGNALHKECFQQWAKKKTSNLDCVYCRSPWALPERKTAGLNDEEGYLNLANIAGVSPERDTSTYYNGPRRGQPYWRH